MPAHRFKFEIAGTTMHGLAFGSEAELDEFMGGRCLPIQTPTPPRGALVPPSEVSDELPARGRPSKRDVITAALETLGAQLDGLILAERARRVLTQIARTVSPDEVPDRRTVERFLTENPVRQKERQNLRQKSKGEKLRTGTGEI